MLKIWIDKLNASNGRLDKLAVLTALLKTATTPSGTASAEAHTFLTLLKYCYNPYLTFGVKKIPDRESGHNQAENPWKEFQLLLDRLAARQVTGHAARDEIAAMCVRFSTGEWNFVAAPVLRRDMRVGVSESSINKVCKKTAFAIPKFACQLATSCEDRPEMKGMKRLEPKLDGVRCLITCIGGNAVTTVYSRNGKIYENFSAVQRAIEQLMPKLFKLVGHEDFVLDGEMISESFQALMRQARRKTKVDAKDCVFTVFDVLPLSDFLIGKCSTPLRKRIAVLEKMRPLFATTTNLELLDHEMVDLDTVIGLKQFDAYAKRMVMARFEGIMIKDLDSAYVCKRSTSWMKWKPTITVDLEVIGVEEGTGKNKGRLGALVCSGSDHGKTITVNVGSGFSDNERDDLWRNSELVIGCTVEILADAVTLNQNGTYSLRFPRFVRFRDDK